MTQDGIRESVRQRAARALPQLEVLGCYSANAKFFYLHLQDLFSEASLLLPIAVQWIEEYRLGCDASICCLDRAFERAARILDFHPPAGLEVN